MIWSLCTVLIYVGGIRAGYSQCHDGPRHGCIRGIEMVDMAAWWVIQIEII